jgi:hypothetical protein
MEDAGLVAEKQSRQCSAHDAAPNRALLKNQHGMFFLSTGFRRSGRYPRLIQISVSGNAVQVEQPTMLFMRILYILIHYVILSLSPGLIVLGSRRYAVDKQAVERWMYRICDVQPWQHGCTGDPLLCSCGFPNIFQFCVSSLEYLSGEGFPCYP